MSAASPPSTRKPLSSATGASGGPLEGQQAGLQVKQEPLALEAAAVARQASVSADHAVTRHYDGDRIEPIGEADRPGGRRRADPAGDLAIARGPARGNLAKRVPDAQLERRARRGQ